jgi:hypothetical protein
MTVPSIEPSQVNELLGSEGGAWRVTTRDGEHYFDLDFGTVTRVPGINDLPTINDRTGPLCTIDTLRIGRRGRWTMLNERSDGVIDYYWAEASLVVSIERISHDDLPSAGGAVPE